MAIMVKVILKRIWRAGIVSVTVLAAFGSVGGGEVHSHSHGPETKVMTLMPDVSSQQIVKRSYPEGNRTLTADSGAATDNLYSQFRRGPSNPRTQPPAKPGGNQKVFQAKIKRRDAGTPVIDVVFNGNKTFEMIVDTGASGTLITQRMASVLGVRPVRTVRAGIADGSVVEFPLGIVRSIQVGGAVIQNVEVAIAKRMQIGLLGHDFFGNYDVKIKKDVVEFYVR
jgi:aspartyl protease family protein